MKIAIVGRPNVGKSALFNRIAGERASIVDEAEGVTRDRIYRRVDFFGKEFTLIDTGGIDPGGHLPFNESVRSQSLEAIAKADVCILVVDAQVGLHPLDVEVARLILSRKKKGIVAVNKVDGEIAEEVLHDFYALALPKMCPVSALQGHRVAELVEAALEEGGEIGEEAIAEAPIRLAIIGRTNVGKSTILNELLGEERSIVSPLAGTTRDAIDAEIEVQGVKYRLIDTAGIRRKNKEKDVVEKFAAIRTEEAIDQADVCLLVFDSFEGFTAQEKKIASMIEEKGKGCILAFNKWDLVSGLQMEHAKRGVREESPFLNHCPTLFLSALQKRNLHLIFPAVKEVFDDMHQRVSTGELNRFVEKCLQKVSPPMIMGKRLRIYYMAQVAICPPRFTLFVNRPDLLSESYKKYLYNQFREQYRFSGCPLRFALRGKKIGKKQGGNQGKEGEDKAPLPDLISQ